MAYQPVTERSYLTEVNLSNAPAVNQAIFFLDVPELSQRKGNVWITGIEVFNIEDLAVSPAGKVVVTTLAGMVLTIAEDSGETVYKYPCQDLRPGNNGGFIRMFNRKKINLPKCFITIYDITGLAVTESVMVNFIYETKVPVRR